MHRRQTPRAWSTHRKPDSLWYLKGSWRVPFELVREGLGPRLSHQPSDLLRTGVGSLLQRARDRGIVGLGFVLVELETTLDVFHRHDKPDDRLFHHLQPRWRHFRRRPWLFRQEPILELRTQRIDLNRQFVVRQDPYRSGQMDRLVEPGRHLIRRDVPVRRYIGIGTVDRE